MNKGIIYFWKSTLKGSTCIIKGIGSFKRGAYVSLSSELTHPQRIILGSEAVLERHSRICANGENAAIKIGDGTTISPYALLKTNGGIIEIGKNCSVNDYSMLNGYGGIKIGDNVHIASHVVIVASEHIYEKLESENFSKEMLGKGVKIESNVWIGANAVILDGVTIGSGSVIGAGAVVTGDISSYSIAVGVPARVIKKWK